MAEFVLFIYFGVFCHFGFVTEAPTTHDSTRYGTSKMSPSSYLAHHMAAISSAIAFADATSIMHAASAMNELPALHPWMGLAP